MRLRALVNPLDNHDVRPLTADSLQRTCFPERRPGDAMKTHSRTMLGVPRRESYAGWGRTLSLRGLRGCRSQLRDASNNPALPRIAGSKPVALRAG